MYQNIIFERTSKRDGLKIEVNARLAGNFETSLTSTDTGKLIQVCLEDDRSKALDYAEFVSAYWDGVPHRSEEK